ASSRAWIAVSRRRKKRRTKPNWNRRKALLHRELNHKMPSRGSANEANPQRVGRLSRARATIGLKRLCRRARAPGRLGAAKVVRCQKQLRPSGFAQDAEGATRSSNYGREAWGVERCLPPFRPNTVELAKTL